MLHTCTKCQKLFYNDVSAYQAHKATCSKSKMQFATPKQVTEDQARIISKSGTVTEAELGRFVDMSLTKTRKHAREVGIKNTGRKNKKELVEEIKIIEAKDDAKKDNA